MLLILIIIIAFIAAFISVSQLKFDYFKKYITFCSSVSILFVVSMLDMKQECKTIILYMSIALSIIFVVFFRIGDYPQYGGGITLNFTNPNLLALWLLTLLFFVVLAVSHFKSVWSKLGLLIITINLIEMLIKTRARSAIVSLGYFCLINMICNMFKNRYLQKIIVTISLLLPLVFVIVYQNTIHSSFISNMFKRAVSIGKPLDSRFLVWGYIVDLIKRNILFGSYYDAIKESVLVQAHNIYLDIWASYGIIVFILFLVLLYRITSKIANNLSTRGLTPLIAFLSLIIAGTTEAALVSGSLGMYILAFTFLIIAKKTE